MPNVSVGMPGKDRRWRRNHPNGMSLNARALWLTAMFIGVAFLSIYIFVR